MKQNVWAHYHPLRKKIIRVGIPLYLLLIALLGCAVVADVVLLGATDAPGVLSIVATAVYLAGSVMLVVLSKKVEKIEIQAEKARFSFLLTEPTYSEIDQVTVELNIGSCILTRAGMSVKYFEPREQVFDEVVEGEEFLPWDKLDVFLASKVENRQVSLALALFRAVPFVTVFNPEQEENQPIAAEEVDDRPSSFFLTMTEEVYAAICVFGLKERLGSDFLYLTYNPDDAFKQLFRKGRIVEMRNKKTGKLFVDGKGNFLGD